MRCTVPYASLCARARSRSSSSAARVRKRAVGVRFVLEHAPDDGVRDASRQRDHRRPRRNSSYVMRRPPSGCTSSGNGVRRLRRARARSSCGRPSSSARAPMCGESARIRRSASAGSARSSRWVHRLELVGVASARLPARENTGAGSTPSSRSTRELGRARRRPAPASSSSPTRKCALRRDRAGVQLLHELDDRDAGLLVARQQRTLDRRRAAPAREERRVDVQPERRAQAGRPGSRHAVGDEDDRVHACDVVRRRAARAAVPSSP